MRGFTLLEAGISLGVFAVIIGTVAAGIVQDTRAHEAMVAHAGPEMQVRRIIHRIGTDLRMAGVWGEDKNRNGMLDEGEDLNNNGVMDADWNLDDGVERKDIAFNTRTDLRKDGNVIATGIYSPKVRYAFDSGMIVREKTRYDESGKPEILRTVLATGIKDVRFARSGGLVRIRAAVDVKDGSGHVREHVLETRVWLRN
ncbi:MAG: PulJ/GspJ family protein [Planctomycetota bacterium]|jgi:hypothetical protein